jgi:hypothetical protein
MSDNMNDNKPQRLTNLHILLSKIPVDMVLRGLPNEDLPPSSALNFPRVRRSPLVAGTVQHLDMVSCWKGLSHSQGLELTLWEHLFKQSLASRIKQRLLQDLVHQLSGDPG